MNYLLSMLLAKFDRTLNSDSDPLRILLVDSAERIVQTTYQLHCLGFSGVSDWTPLLPLPNSNELFSLLIRSKR